MNDVVYTWIILCAGFVFGWCARVAIERAQRSVNLAEQRLGDSRSRIAKQRAGVGMKTGIYEFVGRMELKLGGFGSMVSTKYPGELNDFNEWLGQLISWSLEGKGFNP